MQEIKKQDIPAAASSSTVLSEDDLKARIPLLKDMKQDNPHFKVLIRLLQELSGSAYDASKKYQLMFKVIEIGNLFEILRQDIKNPKPTDTAKTCLNGVALNSFKPDQQLSLFQLARNVSADYFHAMYEDKTREFFEAFISLCRGQCTSSKLLEVDDIFQKLSRGSDIKKVLGDRDEGKVRINKLFCQMGYFLKKADEFIKAGNHEAAAMALIAAGNSGRNFNFSGLNPKKSGSVAAILYKARTSLAHIYSDERKIEVLSEIIIKLTEHKQIDLSIDLIKEEATEMKNPVDIDAYYAKREASGASPRTYDPDLLREPSSITSHAATAASSSSTQSSSTQASRDLHSTSSTSIQDSRREKRDEPRRSDTELYPNLSAPSAAASSSSSHRSSYDDRRRERDRDKDKGHDYARDDSHGHRRGSSPPPHGRTSSSSSSHYQSDRDRGRDKDRDYRSDSRKEGRSYPPSPPSYRAHQSSSSSSSSHSGLRGDRFSSSSVSYPESSRKVREEERDSKHDSKRARGTSESCREEVPRYVKKDDHDDESHKHEKRNQPQHPSSISTVSSSSTQRSASHSERGSSSSHTGSSSHSDVQHTSGSSSRLSTSYGSVLSKPKDWRGVDVDERRDSQPKNSSVTESSQQLQTKRGRAQIEEEATKEKHNTSIKRRY